MFNLEQQISAWRNQMSRAHLSPDSLDELESHLRDDFTQQLRAGLDAQEAFATAAERIGLPSVLQKEFGKIASVTRLAARAKNAMLSFAGIPNHYLSMNAPSSNLDSRTATYLRSAAFLLPAVCLWVLAMIYVIPAFKAIWDGSADRANAGGLDNMLRFNFDIMYLFKDRLFYITGFTIVVLALLEWRSRRWPRYRRAIIGAGVFLVNLAVLFSFALMFLGATFAARQFAAHVK
jgi:hypothetical protein